MKAWLTDGSIIDLVKECGCTLHDGPHWLHMDAVSHRLNQPLRDRAARGDALAVSGLAVAEIARLREKRYQMESRRIVQLLPE